MSHYAAFPRSRYVQARVAEADVDAAEASFLLLTMDQRRVEVQRIASLSDEDLYAEVLVATSTVQQVLDWVGTDVERADSAYAAESRGAQRTTLLEPLAALIGDDPAPAPPLPSPFVRASEKGVAGGVAALDGAGDVVTAAGKKLLTQEAGNSTYGPLAGARPGNLFVFWGDSITAGSDDLANNSRGEAWPVYASIMSGQRIRYVRNAGVPGNQTAQMLARFDADVAAYAPTVVTFAPGVNDVGVTDFATWQGQVREGVADIRSIGAVPVLCTMPPNTLTTPTPNRRQLTVQWNAWLRRYATAEGIILLDFYAVLADPATGGFLAAYAGDGVHPTVAGLAAMGSYAATTLAALLPPNGVTLCQDDADENNGLYKGCFTGYTGSTLPTGWVDNAGTPAGSVLSYTTDSQVRGQMVTLTHTAAAGPRQLVFTVTTASSTLNAGVAAGATSISITVNPTSRGVLFIGSGATAEIVKVSSVSGSGTTWTLTLVRALRYAHSTGETVVVNGTPGDQFLFTGIVTSDGGVAVTAGLIPSTGLGGLAMSSLARPITRGVFLLDYTLAQGATVLSPRLQANGGTGVVSFGQVGVYNATRLGLLT